MEEEQKKKIIVFLVEKFIREIEVIAECDQEEAVERIERAVESIKKR